MQSACFVIYLTLFLMSTTMIIIGFAASNATLFIVGIGLMFVVSYMAQHH